MLNNDILDKLSFWNDDIKNICSYYDYDYIYDYDYHYYYHNPFKAVYL